jgi:diguanylate cyclase (GGDEF)-like protein
VCCLPELLLSASPGKPDDVHNACCAVSIGLAHLRPDDADVATVLARADQALYRAKQDGRNRVHTA